ncbi:MAG TPA: M23 family metallopeptidase [Luteibaculaceae bacterium]|nr:M23 family metallopeptidase [Luteibaculaceae bacterium]
MRASLISVFLSVLALVTWAQVPERGVFISPLDIPLYLSGNFGELRNNHFHTGLDIKTEGREGLSVYAIGSGFVSRIKVSSVGYGLILYIDHPNGFTSTYAHLSRFNDRISDWIKIKQYERRSYEIDITVPEGELPVAKGEIIALSGNSGSSGGPHLHFEIRETQSELAVNPLLFGFPVEDDVAPNIAGWRIFALNPSASVNGSKKLTLQAKGRSGLYNTVRREPIVVQGEVGFALHGTDMLSGTANKCGVYSIDLYIDDTLAHSQRMDKLDFNKGRFLNAHVDYPAFRSAKNNVHKCFLEPYNTLPIYPFSPTRGKILFKDAGLHPIRFVVKDVYGNTSELRDTIESVPAVKSAAKSNTAAWRFDKSHERSTPAYRLNFPAYNLYRDEVIQLKTTPTSDGLWSVVLDIGDDDIPIHQQFTVSFPTEGIADSLVPMAFVAQVNSANKPIRMIGNKRSEGWMSGSSRSFGRFALAIDSVSPIIKPINVGDGMEVEAFQTLLFSGKDNLTGIEDYDLYIDNTWCLLEYDAKYHRFSYSVDPNKILPGQHRLQLVLTDGVGNSRTFECEFLMRP